MRPDYNIGAFHGTNLYYSVSRMFPAFRSHRSEVLTQAKHRNPSSHLFLPSACGIYPYSDIYPVLPKESDELRKWSSKEKKRCDNTHGCQTEFRNTHRRQDAFYDLLHEVRARAEAEKLSRLRTCSYHLINFVKDTAKNA